jgi:YfiH family protein
VRASLSGKSAVKILKASHFEKAPWLIHGFSTRMGGVSRMYGGRALNLGFTQHDSKAAVTRNRERFLAKLVPDHESPGPLVTLRQVHSDIVHRVDREPEQTLTGDGAITDTPGLLLAIQTADCLPVLLVDVERRAVGAFHAGWRGTAQRIVEKGVGEMQRWCGSRARDLKAAIGPGIHGCCYEVGEEVREQFESQFEYGGSLFREVKDSDPVREKYPSLFLSARPPGHSRPTIRLFLDLVEANRRQLLDSAVLVKNIERLPLCTSCRSDLLFSYRKEKGVTGRLMGVVGIAQGIRA